ncbi:Adenylyl-sulfate kinase [Buchnera aphidicola (Eriosoma grossulariae)]|uniref:adenylyl-sulfate kinase n=1 Tax=Buchnera aphidicola TaxID=9 RepID=UPI003463EA7A
MKRFKNLNISFQNHIITRNKREQLHGHQAHVLWFTGLSGSGKSTISGNLEQLLFQNQISTYLLDGDNLRYGICKDLNFTDTDRKENIRRVAEIVKLMIDAGLLVITALISPFHNERELVRKIVGKNNFLEIFVDTPLQICENRDPKKLYKKARLGLISNFTGLTSPYEIPKNPDIYINGTEKLQNNIKKIIDELKLRKIIYKKFIF